MRNKFGVIISFIILISVVFSTFACSNECEHLYSVTNETNATCCNTGETTYTCSLCGDSYTDYGTTYSSHTGRYSCDTCFKSYSIILKEYLIAYGDKTDSSYFLLLHNSNSYFVGITYSTDDNDLYFGCLADEYFLSIDANSSTGTYKWTLTYSDYNYIMWGNLYASTFVDNNSIYTYTYTNCPTSLKTSFFNLATSMIYLTITSASLATETYDTPFTLYNFGFYYY